MIAQELKRQKGQAPHWETLEASPTVAAEDECGGDVGPTIQWRILAHAISVIRDAQWRSLPQHRGEPDARCPENN